MVTVITVAIVCWHLLWRRGADTESITFQQFVRTLARFRPVKANIGDDEINSREAKLYCIFYVNCFFWL